MIPRKNKTCSVCNNSRPLWKSNPPTCKPCALSSRKPLSKKSRLNAKTKQKIDADTRFYKEIWNERPHKCEECGVYLGEQWKRFMFSHILSKGAHPKLRHDKQNINVLCLEHHQQWEFGNRKTMKIYDKNKDAIIKLLQREIN